jgi:hypothetical protein
MAIGLVEAGVVPAQGGQLAPAQPGQGRDQDQGAVARVDRLDQPVQLLTQQPDLAAGDGLVAGGGGAAGTALAQQGGAGQVVVVDGGIEDGAQQRQVCVHRPSRQALGDHGRLPPPDRARVELAERDVTEGRQDALFDLLARRVLRGWVLVLPGRPPPGGHVLADQGPSLGRIRLGRVGEWLAAGTLDHPPLGLGPAQGREDAGRALVGAVLVADLVAVVRVAGGGWDNRDPGHYHASVSQVTG